MKTDLHDCIAQSAVRSSDLAARYGGEAFLLLLAANHEDATPKQAERLIQLVRELNPSPASLVAQHITISMGVASTTPKNT
ncbi:MAG: diguanylate cyclase [Acinetobacter sp.]